MNLKKNKSRQYSLNERFCIIKYFKKFDKTRWMYFGAMWFFIVTLCFIIYDFVINLQINAIGSAWVLVDRFTYQSNILLLIYSIFIVFWPNHQFLKADKFLISSMVYIFFTFVGYNFILSPLGNGYRGDSLAIGSSVWEHAICPILFIVIGFIKMVWNPRPKLKSYWSTMLTGMIYPTIYLIYIATIPFVFNTHNEPTYSVYGIATNTKDHPAFAWPIILCMYIIFFPGSFAIFYFSYWGIRKHLGSKIKNK